MTVVSTTQRNDYIGAGTAGPFAYTFRIFAASDLKVVTADALGNTTVLSYPADYSVAGVGAGSGGSITLTNALPVGTALSVQRVPALLQARSVRNQGPFFPETVEDALDYLTMIDQAQQAFLDRSLRFPSSVPTPVPEVASFLPTYYLRVRADGRGVEGVTNIVAAQNFIQSGTGAVTRSANAKMAEILSVTDFGAVGNGIADDTIPIVDAITAAANFTPCKRVFLPAGRYRVTATIALTSAHAGLCLCGEGAFATTIVKDFSGDLCTLNGVLNFEARHFYVDGQYGTRTGKGFVFTGNCNYPIIDGVHFVGLSDAHIEFGPNAGYYAKVNTQHFTGQGQPDFPSVRVAGPDTTATPRRLNVESNGYIDLQGAFDTRVNGGFVTHVQTDAACSITNIDGTVWANNGVPMTIKGANTQVMGCRMAGDVILDASLTGSFIGNTQTGGTFTDHSIPGNVIVIHHPLASNYMVVGGSFLATFPPSEIQVTASNPLGDTDFTFDPNASASTQICSANLTANRTITLATAGVRNGQRLRAVRSGGNTGGPWTLTIGATGKTLAASQWCEAQFNGSYWEIIGFGPL